MLEYCVNNKVQTKIYLCNGEKYVDHEYVGIVVCLWYYVLYFGVVYCLFLGLYLFLDFFGVFFDMD